MIVFHLTCVMPVPGKTFQISNILATKKQVNADNFSIWGFDCLTLNQKKHHKMCSECPLSALTQAERRDGDATD